MGRQPRTGKKAAAINRLKLKLERVKQLEKDDPPPVGESGDEGSCEGGDGVRDDDERLNTEMPADDSISGEGVSGDEQLNAAEGGGDSVSGEGVSGDGSDEAPEDISLAKGREDVMAMMREESKHIKRARMAIKEKRKRKDEQLKLQKEAKMVKLDLARFPMDDLKKVTTKQKEQEKTAKKKVTRAKSPKTTPVLSTECEIGTVTVSELSSGSQHTVAAGYEGACQFRDNRLYGDKVKRIPVLSLHAKRYRNQPAKNFT